MAEARAVHSERGGSKLRILKEQAAGQKRPPSVHGIEGIHSGQLVQINLYKFLTIDAETILVTVICGQHAYPWQ